MSGFIYNFNDADFEFEPSLQDEEKAIKKLLAKEAGVDLSNEQARKVIDCVVDSLDMLDKLEEYFYLDLHEEFENKALQEFKAGRMSKSDRDDWYGTKRNVIGV